VLDLGVCIVFVWFYFVFAHFLIRRESFGCLLVVAGCGTFGVCGWVLFCILRSFGCVVWVLASYFLLLLWVVGFLLHLLLWFGFCYTLGVVSWFSGVG